MEEIKESDLKKLLFDDDVEQRFIELENRKKKRKKRNKRIRIWSILLIFIIGSVYFYSDMSKLKGVSVKGNQYYTANEIKQLANLSYETRFALIPSFYLAWQLEKDPFIDKAYITKHWNGTLEIEVEEKTILGYMIDADNKAYAIVIDDEMQKVEVSEKYQNTLAKYPLIANFDEENLQKLVQAFHEPNKEVKAEIISMISEITPYKRSYDPNMVKMIMQDGNTIYTSYDGIFLLNDYKKVLREMSETHMCLELDGSNATIVSTKCT